MALCHLLAIIATGGFLAAACSSTSAFPVDPRPDLLGGDFTGDASCAHGDSDCNRCAPDVERQLADLLHHGRSTRRVHDWSFAWTRIYPPSTRAARYYFDAPVRPGNGQLDSVAYHVQGFARTNHPVIRYAGSHSNAPGEEGSVFFLRQEGGVNALEAIVPAGVRHPSGVAVLGRHLLVGEKRFLRVIEVGGDTHLRSRRLGLPVSEPKAHAGYLFGGGLGAAKLAGGEVLVAATAPGGTEPGRRFDRFYVLGSTLGGETAPKIVGTELHEGPTDAGYSENLSLITECGTGTIYGVHTGVGRPLAARGHWRLSRLVDRGGKPAFATLRSFAFRQRLASCHLKSAATAWVDPRGAIELYCHEFANNPGARAADRWRFTRIMGVAR